ncbi:DMT family transporter [Devosia marina]|uniref:EamA family transporter n=1 Tax=Devosia marina TaxID=2683198 RepID=A0A7X3FTP1_9HYPH|nr:DMT family transporter [Devosia marina]MVT00487.1 EamA family transporter [Devosia marina]
MRIVLLTALAMIAFAANSVLARLALADGAMDALSYTGIRILAGAVILFLLVRWRTRQSGAGFSLAGHWLQAGALLGYALGFSLAYGWLGAATGALILFASVQIGMVARAIAAGDRPGLLEWLGLLVALGAFAYLVSPGLTAPDPLGSLLMVLAGLCWAAYSLLGRGSERPLDDTAGNFLRCAPVAILLLVIGVWDNAPRWDGLVYAIASGAVASGLGYAVWYAVLPALTRTRAAIVQLSVPALSAFGAVLFIGEALDARLVVSSAIILGGIGIATLAAGRRKGN